jgi:hypothetical protein
MPAPSCTITHLDEVGAFCFACLEAENTSVTLTVLAAIVMLLIMPQKLQKSRTSSRPPRIRVPNHERALFTVNDQKFVGVIQRLSLTGGSAILSKGPIPQGTLADLGLNTVFGKVKAQIQFLHNGADGNPLAQAFRFIDMDDVSRERFSAAAAQMQNAGFSDVEENGNSLGALTSESVSKLLDSISRLSELISSGRRKSARK